MPWRWLSRPKFSVLWPGSATRAPPGCSIAVIHIQRSLGSSRPTADAQQLTDNRFSGHLPDNMDIN